MPAPVALLAEGVDRNANGCKIYLSFSVALLAEGVDRNKIQKSVDEKRLVALLAEGVDRNRGSRFQTDQAGVALLAEGVDRNSEMPTACWDTAQSPSSRRAWIEIDMDYRERHFAGSPSSRRAWIEISFGLLPGFRPCVALLAEGVDRNISAATSPDLVTSRPPCGGRG